SAALLLVTGPRHTAMGLQAGGLRAASWAFSLRPATGPATWLRQGNPLHQIDSDAAARILWVGWSIVVAGVAWTTAAVAVRRRAHASAAERRAARLVQAAAIAVAAGVSTAPLAAYPERVRLLAGVPIGSALQGHWYTDLANVAPALAAAVLGAV